MFHKGVTCVLYCAASIALIGGLANCAGQNSGSLPQAGAMQSYAGKPVSATAKKRNLAGEIQAYLKPSYSNGGGGGSGGGSPTTFSTTIGELVAFVASTSDGSTLSDCTFNGMPSYPTIVGGYTPGSAPTELSTSTSSYYMEFYFTAPTTGEATATCDDDADDGVITTAPLDYTATAPVATVVATYHAPILTSDYPDSTLSWGKPVAGSTGISWNYKVSGAPAGSIAVAQTLDFDNSEYIAPNGALVVLTDSAGWQLDNSFPYDSYSVSSGSTYVDDDSPGFNLDNLPQGYASPAFVASLSYNEQFTDYFMFQPTNGIWVTLAQQSHSWSGSVYDATVTKCTELRAPTTHHCAYSGRGNWATASGPTLSEPVGASTSYTLPTWSSTFVNNVRKRTTQDR